MESVFISFVQKLQNNNYDSSQYGQMTCPYIAMHMRVLSTLLTRTHHRTNHSKEKTRNMMETLIPHTLRSKFVMKTPLHMCVFFHETTQCTHNYDMYTHQ